MDDKLRNLLEALTNGLNVDDILSLNDGKVPIEAIERIKKFQAEASVFTLNLIGQFAAFMESVDINQVMTDHAAVQKWMIAQGMVDENE